MIDPLLLVLLGGGAWLALRKPQAAGAAPAPGKLGTIDIPFPDDFPTYQPGGLAGPAPGWAGSVPVGTVRDGQGATVAPSAAPAPVYRTTIARTPPPRVQAKIEMANVDGRFM